MMKMTYVCEQIIQWGLLALFLLTPLVFSPGVTTFLVLKETVAEVILLVVIGAWLVKAIEHKAQGTRHKAESKSSVIGHRSSVRIYRSLITGYRLPVVVLGIVILLSLSQSKDLYSSFKDLGLWFGYFFLYFIIISEIKTEKQINNLLRVVLLAGFIAAVYGILQYYGIEFPFWVKQRGRRAVYSTFGNPNYLACYLAMNLPILLTLFLSPQSRVYSPQSVRHWTLDIGHRTFLGIAIALEYACILLTHSRGAWVGLFFGILLLLFLLFYYRLPITEHQLPALIVLILCLLVVTAIYSTHNPLNRAEDTIIQRVKTISQFQHHFTQMRFLIWKSTAKMIKEHPLLGVGIGNFKVRYVDYQAKVLEKEKKYILVTTHATRAHNEYLQIWAETGVFGLLALIWLIVSAYWRVFRSLNRLPITDYRLPLLVGLLASCTVFLVHCVFSYQLHVIPNGLVFWLFLGLIGILATEGTEGHGKDKIT